MRPGVGDPEQALRLAESMRVGEESKEQEALDREGLGGTETARKASRMGFWTRTRTVAVVAILVVVLAAVFVVQAVYNPPPLVLIPAGTVLRLNGSYGFAVPYALDFNVSKAGHLMGAWVADTDVFWFILPLPYGPINTPAFRPGPSNGSFNRSLTSGPWGLTIVHNIPTNVTVTQTIEVVYP